MFRNIDTQTIFFQDLLEQDYKYTLFVQSQLFHFVDFWFINLHSVDSTTAPCLMKIYLLQPRKNGQEQEKCIQPTAQYETRMFMI